MVSRNNQTTHSGLDVLVGNGASKSVVDGNYATVTAQNGSDCFSYVSTQRTCDVSCQDNKPCPSMDADAVYREAMGAVPPPPPPNASCGCGSSNLFIGLAYSNYAGACPAPYKGDLWSLTYNTDDDYHGVHSKGTLTLSYCFQGNSPLFVHQAYTSLAAAAAAGDAVARIMQEQEEAMVQGDDNHQLPYDVFYEVKAFSASEPAPSQFVEPAYCKC